LPEKTLRLLHGATCNGRWDKTLRLLDGATFISWWDMTLRLLHGATCGVSQDKTQRYFSAQRLCEAKSLRQGAGEVCLNVHTG
jgi:hypothetical protein